MSGTLADRVTLYVSTHPGLTARQIAAELHARHQSVREVLDSPYFSAEPGLGGSTTFRLIGAPPEPLPCAPAASQASKMEALLSDGRWHCIGELWEIGIGRPNSRAAELRTKRGLVIEHRHDGSQRHPSRAHQYRLLAGPEFKTGTDDARRTVSSGPASSRPTDASPAAPALSGPPVPQPVESVPTEAGDAPPFEQLQLIAPLTRREWEAA